MTTDVRFNQTTLDDIIANSITRYNGSSVDVYAVPSTRATAAAVELFVLGLEPTFARRDELFADGYTHSPIAVSQVGTGFRFYMLKPVAEREADIAALKVQAQVDYRKQVEANAQKAAEQEAADELAAIEAEVQATLAAEQVERIAAIRARILGEKAAVKRASK